MASGVRNWYARDPSPRLKNGSGQDDASRRTARKYGPCVLYFNSYGSTRNGTLLVRVPVGVVTVT